MDWRKWMKRYNNPSEVEDPGLGVITEDALQDTVGAVAWDSCGNVAAGVSRSPIGYQNFPSEILTAPPAGDFSSRIQVAWAK